MAPDGVYEVLPLVWLQGGSERANPCGNTLMAPDVSSLPLAQVTFATIGVHGWRSFRGQRQEMAAFEVLTAVADQPPVKAARQIARVVHQLRQVGGQMQDLLAERACSAERLLVPVCKGGGAPTPAIDGQPPARTR
jgi:hypothetical protein